MTNNTIPNVPRELLQSLANPNSSSALYEAREELRALLSAPSPAGVDGLDGISERIAKVWIGHAHIDDLITIGKEVDAAQAIIDGLRGEVATAEGKWRLFDNALTASVDAEMDLLDRVTDAIQQRDKQTQRVGELEGLLRDCYPGCGLTARQTQSIRERIDAALSAGKEGE